MIDHKSGDINRKKIYVIAGEASGDALGSAIIKDIKDKFKSVNITPEFYGIGGETMQNEGSFKTLFDISELSVIGVFEVIKRIPHFLRMIKATINDIARVKPDIVITIDVPDFSFRIAKALRKNVATKHIKLVHVVAPTVWAWREGRAKKIAKIYDHLFTLFDFELPYFEKYNLPTTFIGHPALAKINADLESEEKIKDFAREYPELNNNDYITILPGSRESEVNNLLPIYIKAIELFKAQNMDRKDLKLAIVIAPTVKDRVLEILSKYNLSNKFVIIDPVYKYVCFKNTKAAIAAAGTISLELGLCKVPTVVTYILNPISYFLARLLIKVKYASLPNIILGKEVFKELFQEKCNPKDISDNLSYVMKNTDQIRSELNDLKNRFTNYSSGGEVISTLV